MGLRVSEAFEYDETSPSGLRWKVNTYSGKDHLKVQTRVGDIAGHAACNAGGSYYRASLDNRKVYCHRVVWELHFGPIPPGKVVDHIDGNGLNNKIANLRLIDKKFNARNSKMRSGNSTGVTGVKLQENRDRKGLPYYYYVAYWKDLHTGKDKSKCFPVSKLGADEAFRLACEYRARMIDELNQQGAGYSERHGT